jgi:TP901 family phage tail tape measure protein
MAGRFSVEAVFKAIDRVTAPVNRMQNRVGKFTRGMRRGFTRLNRSVDKFAKGVKRGAIAVAAALAVSSAAMANVIGTGAEFEQTLVSAAAKFPGEIRKGTEAFIALEDAAKKTGATTEFTASQSAEALNFLAMAGFNAESSIAALPGVVDLATAAQVDLATATDVASDTLGAFGLATKDVIQLGKNLARVNDVIAKTTTTANTTVETLFETIKDGAPVATTAGASIETFAALAGELANAGIKGSKAGTTLKNMFLSLSAPGTKAAKILRRMGVATKDANGDMLDIIDILGDLDGRLAGLGTADRSGVLEGIFGKIPIAGVNILLKSGTDRLKEYRKQLEGASGASSTMASVMRDTLQGRLNSLNSAVEGVKISIFSLTSGPLSDAVDKMTEWVRVNEQAIATNIGETLAGIIINFENIVLWTGRIAKGLVAFFALVAVLKTVALVLTVINLLAAANPIGLIVLGIVGLIALLSLGALLLMKNWEPIKQFFKDLWGDVVQCFDEGVAKIKAIIAKVKGLVDSVTGFTKELGADIGGGVFDAVQGAKSFLGSGDDDSAEQRTGPTGPQVVSPQDRVARSIEEQRTTSTAEVTIKDETGRAEVTGGRLGTGLQLQQSGAF